MYIHTYKISWSVSIVVIILLIVPDVLETVKELSPQEEIIPAPSGVASFSLSSVNIPDNAMNAVSGHI